MRNPGSYTLREVAVDLLRAHNFPETASIVEQGLERTTNVLGVNTGNQAFGAFFLRYLAEDFRTVKAAAAFVSKSEYSRAAPLMLDPTHDNGFGDRTLENLAKLFLAGMDALNRFTIPDVEPSPLDDERQAAYREQALF